MYVLYLIIAYVANKHFDLICENLTSRDII